jgi:hypothetical protein
LADSLANECIEARSWTAGLGEGFRVDDRINEIVLMYIHSTVMKIHLIGVVLLFAFAKVSIGQIIIQQSSHPAIQHASHQLSSTPATQHASTLVQPSPPHCPFPTLVSISLSGSFVSSNNKKS